MPDPDEHDDPLARAMEEAPLDDEPYTPRQRAEVALARAEHERGESSSVEKVRRRLLAETDDPHPVEA